MRETGLKTYSNLKESSPTALNSPSTKSTLRNSYGGYTKLVIPSFTENFQDKLAETISAQLKSASRVRDNDYDLERPVTSSNRLRTLKIFKQKMMEERKEGLGFYSPKKVNNDQIKIGDSENTVKYLVTKTRREYQAKKKNVIKGTMYVNDLWATDFERDIIKSARIDKELSQAAKSQRSKPGSPVSPMERKREMLKPVTVPSRDNSLEGPGSAEMLKKAFGEKHFLLGGDHQRLYTDRSEEASSAGLRRIHAFTEESLQEHTPFSKKFSHPSLPLWKIEDSGAHIGSIRKYSGDGSQSARNFTTKKGGYMNTDRHMYTFSSEASPITEKRLMSSRGRRDIFIEQKSKQTEMKAFLGVTSHQFNILLDDCETELRDKTDFITKINDLKGLFMNPKFDKKTRRQVLERQQTMSDCKYILDKKSSKGMKRHVTLMKRQETIAKNLLNKNS